MKGYTGVCGVWGDGIGWMVPDGVRWGRCVWDRDCGWVGWVERVGLGAWVGEWALGQGGGDGGVSVWSFGDGCGVGGWAGSGVGLGWG